MDEKKKILITYLLYIFSFIGVCIVGISNVFALETKIIYPNADFTQNANNYIKLNSNGTAGITNVNLTIQGVAYGFYFSMPEQVSNNKTYTMVINFMDLDLLSSFQSNYVHISSCDSNSSCVDSSIISVTKSSSTGNSNKLTIKFNAVANGSYFNVGLSSDGPPYQALTGVSTFGIKNVQLESSNTSEDIINNQNQNANNIINNQNSNTQDIIDNQNTSASSIMENQNQNTQDLIDSNKVCSYIDKNSIYTDNSLLGSSGTVSSNNNFGITNYINITNADLTLIVTLNSSTEMCFYNVNKDIISCTPQRNFSLNQVISIPDNAVYARFTISKSNNKPQYKICQNGNQANSNAINDLNDSINNDDVDSSSAVSFFSNFNDNSHGLSGIISSPLTAINSMLNNQCSPLTATWKNKTISLDCGYNFWQRLTGFKEFLNIALDGLLCYRILLKIFKLVEKLKNPTDDRVEVMDL